MLTIADEGERGGCEPPILAVIFEQPPRNFWQIVVNYGTFLQMLAQRRKGRRLLELALHMADHPPFRKP